MIIAYWITGLILAMIAIGTVAILFPGAIALSAWSRVNAMQFMI